MCLFVLVGTSFVPWLHIFVIWNHLVFVGVVPMWMSASRHMVVHMYLHGHVTLNIWTHMIQFEDKFS
jgi:hypothetical protein